MLILIDIDGTLVPYVNNHQHFYQCACGRRFEGSSLVNAQPISCPSCGENSFKRDEPSIEECRLFITSLLNKPISPFPGSAILVSELSLKHSIIYMTTREYAFYEGTKTWLLTNGFPFKTQTQLIMRKDNNRDHPYHIKEKILKTLCKDKNEIIIIDDDLSLAFLAIKCGLRFIRAPICWEEGTYDGDLLRKICGLPTDLERNKKNGF